MKNTGSIFQFSKTIIILILTVAVTKTTPVLATVESNYAVSWRASNMLYAELTNAKTGTPINNGSISDSSLQLGVSGWDVLTCLGDYKTTPESKIFVYSTIKDPITGFTYPKAKCNSSTKNSVHEIWTLSKYYQLLDGNKLGDVYSFTFDNNDHGSGFAGIFNLKIANGALASYPTTMVIYGNNTSQNDGGDIQAMVVNGGQYNIRLIDMGNGGKVYPGAFWTVGIIPKQWTIVGTYN